MRYRIVSGLMALSLLAVFLPTSAVRATDDPCAPAADGSVPEMCQGVIAFPVPGMSASPEMDGASFSATFTQLVTGNELSRAVFNIESGSIEYVGGSLSATVGCNSVIGGAELLLGDPHSLILAGPMTFTEMHCEGLMDAEAALISILEGENLVLVADGITSSNGLIRVDGGVSIAITLAAGAPLAAGASPIWIEINGVTYEAASGYVTIADGQLSASVGCNMIGAGVRVEGERVILAGELSSTMMGCEGLMEAETALSAVLNGANLHWAGAYELTSDAGSIRFAVTLHEGVPPPGEPSDPTNFTLALLLFFAVIAAAAFTLWRGRTTRS